MKDKIMLLMIIFLGTIFSCKEKENEAGLIYYDRYRTSIWIGQDEINIQPMREQTDRLGYTKAFFDIIANKLWVWNHNKDFSCFFIADISDGKYLPEKEIEVNSFEGMPVHNIFAYDNTAVIEYFTGNGSTKGAYGIVNIQTGEQTILDLRSEFEDFDRFFYVIGYDGSFIFYNAGYYDIEKKEYFPYYFFSDILYPYLDPINHKVIGITKGKDGIIEYDYYLNSYSEIKINKKVFDVKKIWGIYIDKNGVYIAQSSFSSNFSIFTNAPSRVWFKSDNIAMINRKRIDAPIGHINILGRIKNFGNAR